MRVLHVISDTERRGAQTFACDLVARLREHGLDGEVVALVSSREGALPVAALGARPRGVGTVRALRRAMAGADITVAHGSSTLQACALAGLGPGRPFVYRQVSDPVFWTPTWASRTRTALFYRFPQHVVSLAPGTAAVLVQRFRLDADDLTVIPNAADERRFTAPTDAERAAARRHFGLTDDEPVVAYVGALSEEKGVLDLAAAADHAWTVLMAGSGPAQTSLAVRGEHLRLLGPLADVRPLYIAADVVVLPSWSEQQPGVLLEAGLTERATVATAVGLVGDLVVAGVTGRLVPPRDPTALHDALTAVLADSARAAALGTAARRHVMERFSLGVVSERWAQLLGALTA